MSATNMTRRRLGRREFLHVSAVLGLATVAACAPAPAAQPTAAPAAKPTEAPKPAAAATSAPAAAATTAPVAAAKPTEAPKPPAAAATTAPAAAAAAKPTGEANIVNGVDAESLDPLVTTNSASRSMMKAMFDTLVVLDNKLVAQPALATSWENPNDTTWRFKLRQGVKFHDGSPFNAEVAKYSLERFVDPNTKNPEAAVLKPVTAVKVVDEYTLELTTDGPQAALLNALFNAFMMSPTAVRSAGDQVARRPVGTGQYKFVEWVPGERLVMEANPDYWGTKAKINRLVWKPVPEASTRIVALRTGQADLISNVPPQLASQISGSDMRVEQVPGIIITVMFNQAKPPFDNPKVRQALNHAVNVDEIIQFVLGGAGTRLASATKPGMLGHDPDLKPYAYDPEKAKSLLREAGFPNGFEATLDAPNGRYLNDKAVAEAIVGQLNKIGLNIKLNVPEYSNLVNLIVSKQSQFYLIGTVEPASEISFPRQFMQGGAFHQAYENPQLVELITRGNRTLNQPERDRIFRQANNIVHNDAPWLFLYAQQDTYGLRSRLQGFEARPDPYIVVRDWSLTS